VTEEYYVREAGQGKTKATGKCVFQTVEDRDGALKSGMEEGVNESMERLDELLAKA
jgi:uncharacterized protein YndB with AHSA1/START domain